MSAAQFDITIEKYATFVLNLQVKNGMGPGATPADITGYVPRMQIRSAPPKSEILIDLTVANDRIEVVDAVTGQMKITVSADDTADIGWKSGVYDLVITNASETRRLIQGSVSVSDGVTR